jgi:hypothetical protein
MEVDLTMHVSLVVNREYGPSLCSGLGTSAQRKVYLKTSHFTGRKKRSLYSLH